MREAGLRALDYIRVSLERLRGRSFRHTAGCGDWMADPVGSGARPNFIVFAADSASCLLKCKLDFSYIVVPRVDELELLADAGLERTPFWLPLTRADVVPPELNNVSRYPRL
jgi:hypothetical protein